MPAAAEPAIEARRAERDPDRLFLKTTTGDVQAWRPECGIAISASFLMRDGAAHASYASYMTVADHVDALMDVVSGESARPPKPAPSVPFKKG